VIGSLGLGMAVAAADVPVDPPLGGAAEQAPNRPAPRASPTMAPTTADRLNTPTSDGAELTTRPLHRNEPNPRIYRR